MPQRENFLKALENVIPLPLSSPYPLLNWDCQSGQYLMPFLVANNALLTSPLWTKIHFHYSWAAKMAQYFYCFSLVPRANPFPLWPVVFSEEGSTEAWCSRWHFPSCCQAGWHCILFLCRKQGHELPWLMSGKKEAAPYHLWKVSRSP